MKEADNIREQEVVDPNVGMVINDGNDVQVENNMEAGGDVQQVNEAAGNNAGGEVQQVNEGEAVGNEVQGNNEVQANNEVQVENEAPQVVNEEEAERLREEEEERLKELAEEREKFKKDVNEAANKKAHKFDLLKSVAGPNGKLYEGTPHKAEYDAIKIDIPGGDNALTEEQVMAVILGAMMRPDRLDRQLTGSSFPPGTTTYTLFNSTYILENLVLKDEVRRIGDLPGVLVEAKKEAKAAIDAYKNGDHEPAKQLVNNLANYYAQSSKDSRFYSQSGKNYSNASIGTLFGGTVFGMPPFDIVGDQSEIEVTRAKALSKMGLLAEESVDIKKKLLDNPPKAGSRERENLAFDLLFDQYVASMTTVLQGDRQLAASMEFYPLLDKIKREVFNNKGKSLENEQRVMTGLTDNMVNHADTTISDLEVILASPEGVAKLKSAYMDEIIHSETYEKLLSAEGDALTDALIEADKVTEKGITSFSDVVLDNASKDMNDRARQKHDENLRMIENKVIDLVKENRYGLADLKKSAVSKNAKEIASYKQTLSDNTTFWRGSSTNYRNFEKAIDELAAYAGKLSDDGLTPGIKEIEHYLELALEADRLSGVYLDNKKDIDSEYARKRVNSVKDIREKLKVNIKSMQARLADAERQEVDSINDLNRIREKNMDRYSKRLANYNKYALQKDHVHKSFFGNKYTEKDIKGLARDGYSTHRTACYSITIAALAGEVDENGRPKYTFDELMDPNKLLDAKQKMFDEVVKHIGETAKGGEAKDKANEWLADKIYKGQKACWAMMDEQMNGLEFEKSDYMSTEQFGKMMSMGAVMFDVGQETAHCSKAILELAKADGLNFDNIVDYQNYCSDHDGPVPIMMQAVVNLDMEEQKYIAKNKTGGYESQYSMFMSALDLQLSENILKEWALTTGRRIPFSKWHAQNDRGRVTERIINITKNYSVMNLEMSGNSKAFDDIHDDLLNGNLLCDVKLEVNPDNIEASILHGAPTVDTLVADSIVLNMSDDEKRDAIAEAHKSLKERLSKETNPDLKTYIEKAMNGTLILGETLMKDSVMGREEKEANIRRYIGDLVALEWAYKYCKEKPAYEGVELDRAVEGAMKADKAFNSDLEYLGYSTIKQYVIDGKAAELVAGADDAYEKGKEFAAKETAKIKLFGDEYKASNIKDCEVKVPVHYSSDKLKILIVNQFVDKLIDEAFEARPDKEKYEFAEEQLDKIKNATEYLKKWGLDELTPELDGNPDAFKMLYDKYKAGTIFDNMEIEYHPSRARIKGLNELKDMKDNLTVANIGKEAEKAMERLENPTYRTRKDYIKDAATVVAHKVFEQTGELPREISTGRKIGLREYADKLTKSKDFVDSLMSKSAQGKLMNPKAFAKAMKNPEVVRRMILGGVEVTNRPQVNKEANNRQRDNNRQLNNNRPKRSNTLKNGSGPTKNQNKPEVRKRAGSAVGPRK